VRWAVTAALGLALVAAIAVALGPAGSRTAGRPAPALPSAVLVGPRVDLASLRGRPAFINFWASWCGPCRREAPRFERFARLTAGRAKVVGIDWGDGLAGARSFIRRYGLTYPILRDAKDATGARFGLIGLPTTYVLDSRGRIALTLFGEQKIAALGRALARVNS
jgi:cytochrome c biogenesis protein CcmG/thiol:disulfide interchange protein DsbE